MSITLNFTPELERQLYQVAVTANLSPEVYVVRVVQQHLQQTTPRLPQMAWLQPLDKAETHHDELIQFLLSQVSLLEIINFRPPEWVTARVSELLDKNRADQLTATETIELDQYMAINALMTQLKAKARYKLL